MTDTITMGGVVYPLATFKLKELRQAAPHVEKLKKLNEQLAEIIAAERAKGDFDPKNFGLPIDIAGDMAFNILELVAISIRRAARNQFKDLLERGQPTADVPDYRGISAEDLEENTDLDEVLELEEAITAVLSRSGMASKGEGKPATAGATAPATPTEASANSSSGS